jgi:hypothetical protein
LGQLPVYDLKGEEERKIERGECRKEGRKEM